MGECDSLLTRAQRHYTVESFGLKTGFRTLSSRKATGVPATIKFPTTHLLELNLTRRAGTDAGPSCAAGPRSV